MHLGDAELVQRVRAPGDLVSPPPALSLSGMLTPPEDLAAIQKLSIVAGRKWILLTITPPDGGEGEISTCT